LGTATGRKDSVVTDLGEAAREHMLEEAFEELRTRESGALDPLRLIVSITEGDVCIVDGFDAAVGNGNAEDIAAEIFENLFAGTGVFGVNDPIFLPHRAGNFFKEAGSAQSRTELGAKNERECSDRNQKRWIAGLNPACAVQREAARGDEHMNVRMVEHGSRPGMQHREHTQPRSNITGILGQFLKGIGSGLYEKTIEFFGVSPRERTQFCGQGEGQQVVIAGR